VSDVLPRALILDDERFNRRALARELRSDFEVTQVGTYSEAIEAISGDESFDVIVSDRSLGPGPTGLHFLAEAKKVQPNAVRVMASGTRYDTSTKEAMARGDVERFVAKPWSPGELLGVVRDLLSTRRG